jgi:transcriptional regulator with XRE-family HTH domain
VKGGKKLINAHKIKTRIYELQLTQDEIAKEMSLDYSTVNAKLSGKRRIYIDEVAKLCKILHITTSAELKEYFGLDFLIDKKCKNAPEEKLKGA